MKRGKGNEKKKKKVIMGNIDRCLVDTIDKLNTEKE